MSQSIWHIKQKEPPETTLIDYPEATNHIYNFYHQIAPYQYATASVTMYTSPDGGSEITTIPGGEKVQVIGQIQDDTSWVCVNWYIEETRRSYLGNYYFDQDYVAERYYGWIPIQNLTPAPSQ